WDPSPAAWLQHCSTKMTGSCSPCVPSAWLAAAPGGSFASLHRLSSYLYPFQIFAPAASPRRVESRPRLSVVTHHFSEKTFRRSSNCAPLPTDSSPSPIYESISPRQLPCEQLPGTCKPSVRKK